VLSPLDSRTERIIDQFRADPSGSVRPGIWPRPAPSGSLKESKPCSACDWGQSVIGVRSIFYSNDIRSDIRRRVRPRASLFPGRAIAGRRQSQRQYITVLAACEVSEGSGLEKLQRWSRSDRLRCKPRSGAPMSGPGLENSQFLSRSDACADSQFAGATPSAW
jgi:hypothetical protein